VTTYRLGVDIGGTFTDIVLLAPDGSLSSKKILSTPRDYSLAIEQGVGELMHETGVTGADIAEFVHGTTVATNTIIERLGARAALVTTQGFRDVLELGRFRAPRLYDLTFRKPEPLVDRRLCFEVPERTDADGAVLQPVDFQRLALVADQLAQEDVQAVALCFLNSCVNPANEAAAVAFLRERLPRVPISASTELVPQIGEYERTSTTVVNAYIRPVVERYVASLMKRLATLGIRAPLMIMQSSGGILPGPEAARTPIFIIESGPAAGALGAQRLASQGLLGDVIVFDMGGTTAKGSIVKAGQLSLAPETEVGGGASLGSRMVKGAGYIVQVPTIDIAEVGAGGGSIASIDIAGGLHVGPRSAGAEPGPVCYDRGGTQPTVTDANLLLGYLNPEALVGGDLKLNYAKAEAAMAQLGRQLGLSATDAAYGIHRIVNANMMRALTAVTSEGGLNPADFGLVAIGGNGAVHASNLAESLNVRRVLVPPVAGLFSALGMLFADVEHQKISAFYRRLETVDAEAINDAAAPLMEEARLLLESEGYAREDQRSIVLYADVRYVAQSAALSIPLAKFPVDAGALDGLVKAYGDLHEQTYGYRSDTEPLQFVSLKVLGRGLPDTPRVPRRLARSQERVARQGTRKAWFGPEHGWTETRLMPRSALGEQPVPGPLIVEEYDVTTVVRPGWTARRDAANNIVMER
jgi:N-methylhydantoinase A